jgi:hypothetical protein
MLFDALAGNPSEEEYEEEKTKKKMFPGRKSKQAKQRSTKLRFVATVITHRAHTIEHRSSNLFWQGATIVAVGWFAGRTCKYHNEWYI